MGASTESPWSSRSLNVVGVPDPTPIRTPVSPNTFLTALLQSIVRFLTAILADIGLQKNIASCSSSQTVSLSRKGAHGHSFIYALPAYMVKTPPREPSCPITSIPTSSLYNHLLRRAWLIWHFPKKVAQYRPLILVVGLLC